MAGAREADVELEPISSFDKSEQVLQCEFSVLNTNYILALTSKESTLLRMFALNSNGLPCETKIELPQTTVQFTQCSPNANEMHTLDIF